MDAEGLTGMLEALTTRHEERISEGEPWLMKTSRPSGLRGLLAGTIGFELEVRAWRETLKLSQDKAPQLRARVAEGLEGEGAHAVAHLMRTLVP